MFYMWSISWMLMPWWNVSPGHQQPWYWPGSKDYSIAFTGRVYYKSLANISRHLWSISRCHHHTSWCQLDCHWWHHRLTQRQTVVPPRPVFCLLFGVSSDYAQPITGQVTEVTCPVIGWAQPELTPSKRQKTAQCWKSWHHNSTQLLTCPAAVTAHTASVPTDTWMRRSLGSGGSTSTHPVPGTHNTVEPLWKDYLSTWS